MRKRIVGVLFALLLVTVAALPVLASDLEQKHYFGPNVGYPDAPNAKYFYSYYPPDKWDKYGYGTGDMGQGYGPYVYGGKKSAPTMLERNDFGMPLLRPKLKFLGGNSVLVTPPARPDLVQGMIVDVVAFNGAVLETGTVTGNQEIIANLPEGSASIRVYVELANNGFSAQVFPIVPVN